MAKIVIAQSLDSKFSIIARSYLRDKRLSPRACKVANYLFSHAEGWQTSATRIAKAIDMGEGTVKSALRDLEGLGYLERSQEVDDGGKFSSVEYHLYPESVGQKLTDGDEPVGQKASPGSSRGDATFPQVETGGQKTAGGKLSHLRETNSKKTNKGEGVAVGDSQPAPDGTGRPSPDFSDSSPSAGASPADWCTPDDPRCLKHAGLSRHEVPSCRGCQAVREWFADQAAEEVARERQRAFQCGFCGGLGNVRVRNGKGQMVDVRCDHMAPPADAEPDPGHQELTDPVKRRAMIAEALGRSAP